MTDVEALNETLDSKGDIIVAIPKLFDSREVKTLISSLSLRDRLDKAVLPIISSGFICAHKKKFEGTYAENFFDKCWTLGNNISIISL